MTMMNAKKLLRAAYLLGLCPVAACAKPADQAAPTQRAASVAPAGVTLQQFVTRHERKLMADDTDGDGKVSRAEFLAAAKSGKGDPARRFAKMDTNGDGMLDKGEIDAMLTRQFRRVDTNGDGIASADERAAAHGRKGPAAGGAADT